MLMVCMLMHACVGRQREDDVGMWQTLLLIELRCYSGLTDLGIATPGMCVCVCCEFACKRGIQPKCVNMSRCCWPK